MKLISKIFFLISAAACLQTPAQADQNHYTYEKLSKKIGQRDVSLISLDKLMRDAVTIDPSSTAKYRSALELISSDRICNQEEYNRQFLQLCQEMGIETRRSAFYGKEAYDFYVNDEWIYFDLDVGTPYLNYDNHTFVTSDDLIDDPFLVLRSNSNFINALEISSIYQISPSSDLKKTFLNASCGGSKKLKKDYSKLNKLIVTNSDKVFNYTTPTFQISNTDESDENAILWQISADPEFKFVPGPLTGKVPFSDVVTLDPIAQTFLNSDETYYFRVRASNSKWSKPFAFTVIKPEPIIDVEFDKLDDNLFEINWERYALQTDEAIEYLVFGSNSLDFVPSIYSDVQINLIEDGEVKDQEPNDNLVAITHDHKILVNGKLAYYRIIVREKGQLSVPSRLIHVYDSLLIQPRNVLQVTDVKNSKPVSKRMLIATTYPWTEISLPRLTQPKSQRSKNLFDLADDLKAKSKPTPTAYPYNPHVQIDIWDKVVPYFLPENHPAKAKLDRMFSSARITQSPETFKKAGFIRYKPGRFSRIMASSHPELKEYYIKGFSDEELKIPADWMKLIHRIKGAAAVKACIKAHNLQSQFKVPRKWIYPLPLDPSPPHNARYLRKNFILVAENMGIVDSETNKKMYKTKMTKNLADGLFTLLHEVGLWDSVFAFNIPFCKDGKLAVIDTEYHHKWPVPFTKMSKYFSDDIKHHWEGLAKKAPSHPNK